MRSAETAKLGTAWLCEDVGDGIEGEEFGPGMGEDRFFLFVYVFFEVEGVHPLSIIC